MKERDYDIEPKYLTQQEVADLFRVKPGTVKNWREAGLLEYFQAPGSSRVLYPKEVVDEFEKRFTKRTKPTELKKPAETRKTPGMSSKPVKEWRI